MTGIIQRLKPYGSIKPSGISLSYLRAYAYGIRDGWRQPHDLGTSRNVEHLPGYGWGVQNTLDAGINLGQWLRSPLNHQQEG